MVMINAPPEQSDEAYFLCKCNSCVLQIRNYRYQILISAIDFKDHFSCDFLKIVRGRTEIEKLDARIIREFVDKVYVHKAEMFQGHKIQRIDIAWNFIGIFDSPSPETEYLKEISA